MIKVFSTVILLLFLISADQSFAQGAKGIKIYSGYLYQQNVQHKTSFWHGIFGVKSPKKVEAVHDRQCFIEFRSPVSFSHQTVAVIPEQLTYVIRFNDGARPSQGAFEKFIIKIYTNDDEEYSIDPDAEGRQVGINDEHHIFDSYLIYLISGSDINHLEIVNPSGNDQDKYILDKLEVHDNH